MSDPNKQPPLPPPISLSGIVGRNDPRYQSWQMISAFVQREDNAAREKFLRRCQIEGTVQEDDVIRLVNRIFNSYAQAMVATVTGTAAAEQRALDLDELLEYFMDRWKGWFLLVEQAIGTAADKIQAQVRLRLTTTCGDWKARAFQFALDSEAHRIKQSGDISETGAAGHSAAGPSGKRADLTAETWEDVELRFLSDERVQIFIRGIAGDTMNFAEMGFEDRRGGGGKPTRAWHVLLALAESGGVIPASAVSGQQRIQKYAQAIRHLLRKHFRLSENPLTFIEGTGYKTRFKITRSPAYET